MERNEDGQMQTRVDKVTEVLSADSTKTSVSFVGGLIPFQASEQTQFVSDVK